MTKFIKYLLLLSILAVPVIAAEINDIKDIIITANENRATER